MTDDNDLWNQYINQEKVKPIKKNNSYQQCDNNQQNKSLNDKLETTFKTIIPHVALPRISKKISSKLSITSRKLDRKTDDKIRKGSMLIEDTLDLHGMRQEEAYNALCHFIERSYAQKKRFVLIITGKGEKEQSTKHWMDTKRGVLKQRVPDWLSSRPCNQFVLKISPAQPKDGGDGALYIYLRNNK